MTFKVLRGVHIGQHYPVALVIAIAQVLHQSADFYIVHLARQNLVGSEPMVVILGVEASFYIDINRIKVITHSVFTP